MAACLRPFSPKFSASPSRGSSPTISTDETRQRLLEAAADVFAEVGFRSATVRQICSRAGVNVALVKYHFGDKSQLYAEVLRLLLRDSAVTAVQERLEEAGQSPEATLREVLRIRLRGIIHHQRSSWHLRLVCHEIAQPTPAIAEIYQLMVQPIRERALHLVGSILGLPPDHQKTGLCVASIAGQALFYVLGATALARLNGRQPMSAEECDKMADHITDFSLAYLHQERT